MAAMIDIAPGKQTLAAWRQVYLDGANVRLDAEGRRLVTESAQFVAEIVRNGVPVYGVNTGFGKLSNLRIADNDLAQLQRNLVLSHTVGVGDALPDAIVRLVIALKIAALAHGASGVRPEVVEFLEAMLVRNLLPVIPAQGSVGASGDLAPLAHLSAVMIGHGRAKFEDTILPGAEAIARAGLAPLIFGPKEGLAMLNGTQVSTSLALAGLFEIENVFRSALVTGALSTEASLGSVAPFDPRIQRLRPHPGQIDVAAALRALLDGGDFRDAQAREGRLQDPYCLRCQPQLMGAVLDVMRAAAGTLTIEAAGASDNPLILLDGREVLSGGNFHAESVAFAADMLANAIAEVGAMAERRVAFLIDSSLSGLPAFLTADPGLSSGFMSLQIVAAALVSENRQRSHPASVDSVPTVGNQEDIVSMATHGARRLLDMAKNAGAIVAIELLAAVEGMDHRAGLRSNSRLEAVRRLVRAEVPSMARDREFSMAIEAAVEMVRLGRVATAVGDDGFPVLR